MCEGLRTKESVIKGEKVFLICPEERFTGWTPQNVIYRSSIWNEAGEPISLGFKKFFNMGEKPHILGEPDVNTPVNVLEKCDGSLIVVSVYRGELIVRTRGTFTCASHGRNGQKVVDWVKARPLIKYYAENMNCSLVFEGLDPNNRIILKHDNLNLVLLNVIHHADYSYMEQNAVDLVAAILEVDRPKRFSLTLAQLVERKGEVKDFEGWCVYFNNDQNIVKLKTDWYLKANRLKFDLKKIKLLHDLVDSGANSHKELMEYYAKDYDFELLSTLDTKWLFEAKAKYDEAARRAMTFANEIKDLAPKERAHAVKTNLTSNLWDYAFQYLAHGSIGNDFKFKRIKRFVKNDLQENA